nr:flagellar hook-basal body protein [Aneurinibacillus terranovensis]
MLRGIDAAASGMIANQARQEAITNNLANVNTPGYKADDSVYRSFPELLLERIHDTSNVAGMPAFPGGRSPIGQLSYGVYNQELVPNFVQGSLVETGKPLDIALSDENLAPVYVQQNGTPIPPGQVRNGVPPQGARQVQPKIFFAVQTVDEKGQPQVSYTRNGNWTMDANGMLATPEGHPVLGANGQTVNLRALLGGLPLDSKNLQVTGTGQLIVPGSTAPPVQLRLVKINNPDMQLVKQADTTFRYTGPAGQGQPPAYNPAVDGEISIKQGFIERSNVDAGRSMIDMLNVMRSYEANQKVLSAYDTTLQKLNEVGRIG